MAQVVTVFFFSGHGEQRNGSNYLIPTGDVTRVEDHAYDLDILLKKLNDLNACESTHVVLLDCCRENDKDTTWKSKVRTKGGPAMRGLAECSFPRVRPVASRYSPANFFILYACAPGTVALEPHAGPHGYFTQALLENIDRDEVLVFIFGDIVKRVEQLSKWEQRCWKNDNSSNSRFRLVPPVIIKIE